MQLKDEEVKKETPKRFIKVKLVNTDRQRVVGKNKNVDLRIVSNEADGTLRVYKDGYEGEISEYVYSNLTTALHTDYELVKMHEDPNIPAALIPHPSPRFNVIKLSDFYEKDQLKKIEEIKAEDITPEIIKVEKVEPEKPKRVINRRPKVSASAIKRKRINDVLAGATA